MDMEAPLGDEATVDAGKSLEVAGTTAAVVLMDPL